MVTPTLLKDLTVIHLKLTLFCENQTAIHIAANPIYYERKKPIDIDCYAMKLQVGLIKTLHLSSLSHLGDIFTKPLSLVIYSNILSKMDFINIYTPS